tara:strand:+ start:531 stop:1481 length:951 start_codon:yes stop_codon:yes gene_type:complete
MLNIKKKIIFSFISSLMILSFFACSSMETQSTSIPTLTVTEDEIHEGVTCTLNGGEVVKKGWSGKDTGTNYCNQCMCLNGGLGCTKMACPPVKSPASPIITPTTPVSGEDEVMVPWGFITSLPVEVSAVLAAGPLLNSQQKNALELRTFRGFGMPTPKPDNPEMLSPQWEFAVPAGTPALAPVTGYVVAIPTLWSDDFSVWLSADGENSGVWEVEHVIDVLVEVGDFVEAGQSIATASVFGGREVALVELGLLVGGQTPSHYCPLLYVKEDALAVIKDELNKIRKENFDRLTKLGISIPVNDPNGQSCWTDLPVFH